MSGIISNMTGPVIAGLAGLLLSSAHPLWAQDWPDLSGTNVTDLAGKLTTEDIAALEVHLAELEAHYLTDFEAVTIPSIASVRPGATAEALTDELLAHWGFVGMSDQRFLVAILYDTDRYWSMRVEGDFLPQITVPVISLGTSEVTPLLKAGDFASAFRISMTSIAENALATGQDFAERHPEEAAAARARLPSLIETYQFFQDQMDEP